MKCKTVTLRKRKIKNGTQYSLCLDYYPGYRDNVTMKVITREADKKENLSNSEYSKAVREVNDIAIGRYEQAQKRGKFPKIVRY